MGYAHPPFFPLAEYLMRTSHRGSPSFVSPRKPPVKEEWIEEQNQGRLSVVCVRLTITCYVMLPVQVQVVCHAVGQSALVLLPRSAQVY